MTKKHAVLAAIALIAVISISALVLGIIAIVQINTGNDDASKTDVTPDFPESFEFGAATSAFQIEGAWDADGKSPSIWDDLVHNHPERIADNSTADEAAESYYRYKEDVQLLKDLGVNFYRFSISWSRLLPDGTKPNEAGIKYYNNLINELIANKIKPMVTIYHWDLPQYIQKIGGWTNPLVVDYFEQFASLVYERFSDRVKTFITFNEPFVFCKYGYGDGTDAPLVKSSVGLYECGRNVLLAHAKAYHIYQKNYAAKEKGQVGICLNSEFFWAVDGIDPKFGDQAIHSKLGWFANPIFSRDGNYPQVMIDNVKRNSGNRPWSRLPEFTKEEIDSIKGSADFLALNYYSSRYVKPRTNSPGEDSWDADVGLDKIVDPSWKRGKSAWLYSVPQGLQDLLVWIKNNYDNPTVLITENGYSDDGETEDDDRVEYIKQHLTAMKRAINEGCRVVAYTVWSLLDNFEWQEGYSERFGIYYVDFKTKRRIQKKSARYFTELTKHRKI